MHVYTNTYIHIHSISVSDNYQFNQYLIFHHLPFYLCDALLRQQKCWLSISLVFTYFILSI